jgi:hyperosmotically inducible periplasmic protein
MKALLMCVMLVIVAVVAFNYWNGVPLLSDPRTGRPAAVGTTGTVDVNAARERGAEVGEKVAVAAAKVRDTAQEAALTSKIKAKMVLDDTIKARSIDVTTEGTTVTVSGAVRSVEEHDRAIRLARETEGVTQVVDRLKVESK